MNKYQEALDYVNKSVCTALTFLGVEDKKTHEYLHILQEAVNKTKAFDVLMSILNNDTFIMDTENYNKTIQISQGYQKLEIPISDEDFEILEKVMEEDKNEKINI